VKKQKSKENENNFSGNFSYNFILENGNLNKSLSVSFPTYLNTIGGGCQHNNNEMNFEKELGSENMNVTLQRYKEYLCGEHKNKTTIKNNYNVAKRFYVYVEGVLSKENVLKWRQHINTKSHNTINVSISAVNKFLLWFDKEFKEELQMKTIGQKDTDKETLTEQEIDTLFGYSKKNKEQNVILHLLWHGLRPSDVINLKISNIRDDILYLKDTKTGDNHTILNEQILDSIKQYRKTRPRPKQDYNDYLLICDKGDWKGKSYVTTLPIQKKIAKLSKSADISKHVTPYTIRRTSVTLRLDKDSHYYAGDVKIVQRLFRHKTAETTLRYDHKTDDHLRKYLQEQDKDLTEREKDLTKTRKDLVDEERTYPLNSF
jgi:integrase